MRPSTDTGLRLDPGEAIAPINAAIDSGCSRSDSAIDATTAHRITTVATRRACGGPDQVQILEKPVELLVPRRLLFGLQAGQHVPLDAAAFLGQASRHTGTQQRAHFRQALPLGHARRAATQMGLYGHLRVHAELAVVVRGELAANQPAVERAHRGASCSTVRNAWRARVSRDFTVPSVTPSEKAISS